MADLSPLQNLVCAYVLITGKVQGVGYRISTFKVASKLGLTGWVRNLADGRVEAVFEGNRNTVEEMIAWCRRGNPPAVVKEVTVEYKEPEGNQGFEIRR